MMVARVSWPIVRLVRLVVVTKRLQYTWQLEIVHRSIPRWIGCRGKSRSTDPVILKAKIDRSLKYYLFEDYQGTVTDLS